MLTEIWTDLFLQGAGECYEHRLIPGCAPAPRLVGVETNPGPKGAKTSKPAQKTRKRVVSAAARASNSGRSLQPSVSATSIPAPVSHVHALLSSAASGITRVPFDSAAYYLVHADAVGLFGFGPPAGAVVTKTIALDPNTATFVFGGGVERISQAYSRFRLVSLEVDYEPFVPTATTGAFSIGMSMDPAAEGALVPNFNSISGSIIRPVWSRGSACVPRFNRDWLYCADPSTGFGLASSERQTSAGTIVISSLATGSPGATFGALRLRGVIEFKDLVAWNAPPDLRVTPIDPPIGPGPQPPVVRAEIVPTPQALHSYPSSGLQTPATGRWVN